MEESGKEVLFLEEIMVSMELKIVHHDGYQ